MQSESPEHAVPRITSIVLVVIACSVVAHRIVILCGPSARLGCVRNVNGAAVSVAFGRPSIDRSTSWIGLDDVQSAWIMKPAETAAPWAGDLTVSVGATAPAGPNSLSS